MADVAVSKQTTTKPNTVTKFTRTSIAAGNTAVIKADYNDQRTLILVQNASASDDATLTLHHGNAYGGVNDVTAIVEKGTEAAFTLDSTIFKNVSGVNAGKIRITSDKAVSIAVVEAKV
jgi:hypothetical protein|nr:MAG TPA: hypothetical protein [Caudoviricetes sp.]